MNRTKSAGFTLIELMIVVAIIGILASIALGFYGENVIASNRTEGRSALQQAAGTLEKCKSLYGRYDAANCNYADFTSESNFYAISGGGTINATSFTLTATPVTGSAQASDTDCTAITLTNTGVKNGTGADPTQCW